jgi:hypothetical protein
MLSRNIFCTFLGVKGLAETVSAKVEFQRAAEKDSDRLWRIRSNP